MDILVTGGTGFLGRHLARALLSEGHRVRLMGRNMEDSGIEALLNDGAVPVRSDLRDRAAVAEACRGAEVVFHVGALSAPWGKRSEFFGTNVGGTQSVVSGCRLHGVRRLVYVSSPSVVFDGRDHINLREDAPYPRRFASVYSLTKKLGEDVVNGASSSIETVILRPKAMFGPGDVALLPRLIAAARRGRLPQIGNGRNRVDLTYVDNVVHALLLSMASPAAPGHTYTITNDEHPRLWSVIRDTLRRLGLPTRLRRIPLPVALAVVCAMEAAALVTGREPTLTRYSAAILARTQTYDITAAKRDLGYAPVVSFAEGMERTLFDMSSKLKVQG
ncbi:MAG: NAD-dependent epimerase/dehydratase family protein [Chloroflexia bacterium]